MSDNDTRFGWTLQRIDEQQMDWPTDPTLQEERIVQITAYVDQLPYRLAIPTLRKVRPGRVRTDGFRLTCLPVYYERGSCKDAGLGTLSVGVTPQTLAFLAALIASQHACPCSLIPVSGPGGPVRRSPLA